MAKLPEPPDPLGVPAAIKTLKRGTTLWRIYFAGGAHPATWGGFRFYGPTNARFDHHARPPSVQARGIIYAASDLVTCLAEVFQATRVIERASGDPWIVGF